jgi:hypothetical protein
MNKPYLIKLNDKIIGKTKLEKADPSMGIVFGKIINSNKTINYEFIKYYCQKNRIKLVDDCPEDKFISTKTIEQLKVISSEEIEIKGLGNQISGMDSEGFEISIEGVGYPFYEEEFPHHVKEYEERFKEE